MSNRLVPSGFLRSVLQNGVGRHVCQLQRLTLKFCKSQADSRGMRDFIENELLEFTRANPGIVVYLQPRRHRTARLVAEYLNGNTVQLYVNNYSKDELCQWIGHLKNRSGQDLVRIRKQQHTDTPSIQGIWTPFTNKSSHLNVTEFPSQAESVSHITEESATERLLQMAQKLRSTDLYTQEDQLQQDLKSDMPNM